MEEQTKPSARVTSPCVKLCHLDTDMGLCTGCGRSLKEIASWSTLAESERIRICKELPQRLKRALADAAL